MKKLPILGLLFTLILSIAALGFAVPHVVYGSITHDGVPVKNIQVRITNLITGASDLGFTDSNGRYQFDLSNVDPNYRGSDSVKISLVYCESSPSCSKSSALGGGNTYLAFDLVKESLPIKPADAVVVRYVCWDGTAVESQSSCPVQSQPEPVIVVKEVTVEKIYCEDGTEVGDKADCAGIEWEAWLIGLIAGIIGLFAWGKGFAALIKYYLKKAKEFESIGDKATAKRYKERAEKMAKTVITNFLAGKYKQ